MCAEEMNCSVKLIGYSHIEDGKVQIRVCPMLIPQTCPLYSVEDVFNSILVTGDMVGDVMFYGRGAGKEATASAVVADLMDVVRGGMKFDKNFSWNSEAVLKSPANEKSKFLVRTNKEKSEIEKVFGKVTHLESVNAFVTEKITESDFNDKAEELGDVLSKLRVYE